MNRILPISRHLILNDLVNTKIFVICLWFKVYKCVNIIETEKERKISDTNYFVDFMFMLIEYFNRDTLIFCTFELRRKILLINRIKRIPMKINFKPVKKILYWIGFILIIILGVFVYWKYGFTYSKGYRAGLLQKFSEKGVVFKTYEGEMILSSVQSNANVAIASEKFLFSVADEAVAKQMEQIQGKNVVVHYHEKNGVLPWVGESKYIVDSVRVADVGGGTYHP